MSTLRTARLLTTLLSVTAIIAAAGCGGSAGGGEVRLLVFGAPEELDAYRTLVTAYEESEPESDVQLIEASDREDLIARLSTSIAGGSPPDLFLMNYRYYGQFAAKGAIEPLDARIDASTAIDPADFYETAMAAFQWRGEQLCLPQNVSSLAVYYNRDLFEEYGVAEPQPGWTWSDLRSTAVAMTRDANGVVVQGTESEGGPQLVAVYGLGMEPTMIQLAPFVWSNGGEIVDDTQRPTRLTLESPEAREALRNWVDLHLAYGVIPPDELLEAETNESRFANGRLGMLLSSRRSTTTFRTAADFDWDVAELPTYDEKAGILHSDAYCIPRGATNKDEAWRFTEFALGAEGQQIMASTGRTVPSRIDVAESAAFLDSDLPPRNGQAFLDAIPTVRTAPIVSTWPEIEDVSEGILENALYRGDRLDDVIRDLDELTRPIFARGEYP